MQQVVFGRIMTMKRICLMSFVTILGLSTVANAEIMVAASLEWLADHCIDSGIYRVVDAQQKEGKNNFELLLALKQTLRGKPIKWTKELYYKTRLSNDKRPLVRQGDEFLICFQHYSTGEKRAVQIINLDNPQIAGFSLIAVSCDLKLLKTKENILKVFERRIESHPKADPVEISDYSKDNRFELRAHTEIFAAVYGGSSCYLRVPKDLAEKVLTKEFERKKRAKQASQLKQPETTMRALCEKGDYHTAMRELPKAMEQWTEYTKRTGNTAEGAAGFEYVTTMLAIAEKGDAHWGKILDDPEIPYKYKTEMIFEILETRLGKGAVYVEDKRNFIVPRLGLIDFNIERIQKIEKKKAHRTGIQEQIAWVNKCLSDFDSIKVGRSRKEIERQFPMDGGIQGVSPVRFTHPECPHFKVDVEFSFKRNPHDQNRAVISPEDKSTKISKPYLERFRID